MKYEYLKIAIFEDGKIAIFEDGKKAISEDGVWQFLKMEDDNTEKSPFEILKTT